MPAAHHPHIRRRSFLAAAATVVTAPLRARAAAEAPMPVVIDCHTHFYDPTRPHGVPWPAPGTALYRRVMPADFRALAVPLGVTGTVVVEASVWLEDNQWLLDLADREPFIVGVVGNLSPGTPDFAGHLARFSRHRLYRGIRIGGKTLAERIGDAAFVDDLRRLAAADLSLDLNGNAAMLPAVAKLAQAVPDLRIVIDHVGGPRKVAGWDEGMKLAASSPGVYCKVSALLEQDGSPSGQAPTDVAHYAPILDLIWQHFGADRVIYGSNWPVCECGGSLAAVYKLVADFITPKGPAAAQKFFAANARAAYKWVTR